jgi:hypothetical protein
MPSIANDRCCSSRCIHTAVRRIKSKALAAAAEQRQFRQRVIDPLDLLVSVNLLPQGPKLRSGLDGNDQVPHVGQRGGITATSRTDVQAAGQTSMR